MNARPWIFAASASIVATALFVLTRTDDPVSEDSSVSETMTRRDSTPSRRIHAAPQRPDQPVTVPSGPGRADRDAMRQRIRRALRRRYAPPHSVAGRDVDEAATEDADDELPPGNLDREYIQQTVRDEVVPLVRECYDQLLQSDDRSAGRVVMQFEIMGDETVGGIVDGVTLTDDTELTQEEFSECVRESMASAIFDPPEGGGVVSVTYPMIFEPQPS